MYEACVKMSSGDVSPVTTPSSASLSGHPPKSGTIIPSRIFVGGIAANGNMIPVEQLANRIHSPVTEVNCSSDQTSVATVPMIPVQAATKNAVVSYKKHHALTRRSFSSPTIFVKHGHKVQIHGFRHLTTNHVQWSDFEYVQPI